VERKPNTSQIYASLPATRLASFLATSLLASLGPSGPPRRGLSVLPSRVPRERAGEERRADRRVSQSRRRWTRSCALIKYYVRLTECRARKRRRSSSVCPSFDRPLRIIPSARLRLHVSSFESSVDRRMASIAGCYMAILFLSFTFYCLPNDSTNINSEMKSFTPPADCRNWIRTLDNRFICFRDFVNISGKSGERET